MEKEDVEALAKRAKQVFFAEGDLICGPADGVAEKLFIVKEGLVRGGELGSDPTWELSAGECFPVGAVIGMRPPQMTNRAAEDTFCLEIAAKDFFEVLHRSPEFNDFCTRRMANLLGDALRSIQARSAGRVADAGASLDTPCHRLIARSPFSCRTDTPLSDALGIMARERIGSMIVVDEAGVPRGILTLYDMLSRVTLPALPLATPIGEAMNPDLLTIGPEQAGYEAAILLTRHGKDHICVVDDDERLIGVLSERDLFSLQRIGLVSLSRTIASAQDVEELAGNGSGIHSLVEQMIAQGASVDQLNKIITELNDAITQRVIELNLKQFGEPPAPFVWLSFGSEGRIEQTLKTDQDNGILFVAEERDKEAIRQQFLELAKGINQDLARCGFPLCPGNIMASNPECCLTLKEWQDRFAKWIEQGTPEHLLYATIFFDFRPLYGDETPVRELRDWLSEKVKNNSRFRQQMAVNALRNRPPLGLFTDFRVTGDKDEHPHTLDLKLQGVTPFVDGARLIALAGGGVETNTLERFREGVEKGRIRAGDADAWIEAYQFIQLLRMRNHQRQAEKDRPLDNHFDPDKLNELDRRILKEAFRQARKLQSKLSLEYQL
jgi:CBS domain-containing protein